MPEEKTQLFELVVQTGHFDIARQVARDHPQHVYVGSCYLVTPGGPRLLGRVPPEEKILAVA